MTTVYAEHAGAFDPTIVAALWSVSSRPAVTPAAPTPYRVLPDGCLDIVLRVRTDEPDGFAEPDLFIGGPARAACLVAVEPAALVIGVRFQPGHGGSALGLAASELTDLILPGADARAVLGAQAEMLRGARTAFALQARLQAFVAIQADMASRRPLLAHVRAALAILRRSRGRAPVAGIARQIGVSERTLHRSVTEAAGLSPKMLAGVLRFQHALAQIRRGLPLAEVATQSGYSDQSHMTRAFRSLGDLTPGASAA